jgi:hypothetical protein
MGLTCLLLKMELDATHFDLCRAYAIKTTNIMMIKSRRMRWAGHVARMREMRNAYTLLVGKPEGKLRLGNLGVNGRKMLNLSYINKMGECGLDSFGSETSL